MGVAAYRVSGSGHSTSLYDALVGDWKHFEATTLFVETFHDVCECRTLAMVCIDTLFIFYETNDD